MQHSRTVPAGLVIVSVGAMLVTIFAVTRTSLSTQDSNAMAPIETYLVQFGIGPGLPELALSFDEGRIELHASADLKQSYDFFANKPGISWSTTLAPYASVFFMDNGPDRGTEVSSSFFPFVHSLWTDCTTGRLDGCGRTVVPWRRPGNTAAEPNRYTFLLFVHDAPLSLLSEPAVLATLEKAFNDGNDVLLPYTKEQQPLMSMLSDFSYARLLSDNVGMRAVSYTFMSVHG